MATYNDKEVLFLTLYITAEKAVNRDTSKHIQGKISKHICSEHWQISWLDIEISGEIVSPVVTRFFPRGPFCTARVT